MKQENSGLAKPKLRGVIHLVMSPISLVAGLVMISAASELRGRITLGIFTLTAVTLFTCSALYHRVKWSEKYRGLWRRIDHANIPILIAGTYTPFAVFLLDPNPCILRAHCRPIRAPLKIGRSQRDKIMVSGIQIKR